MDANALSPRDLFGSRTHYEVPAFQRPYVWNEEDQWSPLWDDVVRVGEAYVQAKLADPDADVKAQHFLGAVVYQAPPPVSGDVTRPEVIDGQQRMTTLQVLIDGVYEVVRRRGHSDLAESLEELIVNGGARFHEKRERFKFWPSHTDREAFALAMGSSPAPIGEHPILAAHAFFELEAERWLSGAPDEDGISPPGSEDLRVEALSSTLQDRLLLVAIDLTGHDDAQIIFETLNDRGTPLLKADLIKNWLFRKGDALGADTQRWAESEWAEFDGRWWREEMRQGRLNRSRIDIFLQYWLTMRRKDEVKADNSFRVFVEYAEPMMTSAETAHELVAALRRDADTYRAFAQLDPSEPEGRFYTRVIERLELAATTPVFLWLLSPNHAVPPEQRRIALEAFESWAIRRMLLRLTTKDINKFAVAILKMFEAIDAGEAGDRLVAYLSEQTAEARIWPGDDKLRTDLADARLYGNIRQDRLRVVLGAVEQHLRGQSQKYESLSLPNGLEIEHVMPQGWRTYWDPEKLAPEPAAARDRLVNTLGNLTLVTKSLNGSLSNRPWTDAEAAGLQEGGSPGEGKRTLLNRFSLLVINKDILESHPDAWSDSDIRERARLLTAALCDVWPGPVTDFRTG
jgi:hypothetical protein